MKKILKIVVMLRPYWRFILQSLCVSIIFILFSIPGPYLTKVLIDHVYPHKNQILLILLLLVSAVVSTSLGLMNLLSSYFGKCVGINMELYFKSSFYRHIQSLDFSFFDNRKTGEIISRFKDMNSAIQSVIRLVNSIFLNTLYLLVFPPILIYIDWKLALLSLAVLPFDTLLIVITRKHLRRLSEKITEASAELSAKIYESISAIRTVQALGIEAVFTSRIRDYYMKIAKMDRKSTLLGDGSSFLGNIFKTASTLAYGWYGWTQIIEGNLSLGSYMAFTAYTGYLYSPIGNLINLIGQVEMMLVHINRFLEIHDLEPNIYDNLNLPYLVEIKGDIRFHNVDFCYDENQIVLENINFQAAAHTTTAIVGKSGSGKSTLVKLIPRFYDPRQGYISIDGQDIRSYRLKSLRNKIGIALQGSTLFQGTILDNLTFGQDFSFQKIENATRSAYIHDFISSLPKNYQTLIGEQGVQLSEGQKQRIALARVLLRDSPILLLDEPTSALDMESETKIQEALKNVRENRTVVIIAHRLSTIQSADKIIVLENGRITEEGSHDTLLLRDGVYANLHNLARI